MSASTAWRCLRARTLNAPSQARGLIRASAHQCLRQAPLTSLCLRVTLLLWTPAAVAASTLHETRDCLVTASARGGGLMPAPALAVLAEVRLNSGRNIPSIGFGTFLIPPGRATYDAVRTALGVGYRHLDTAQYYDNERDVGKAVADSGLARNELFITTKIYARDWGYRRARAAVERSLRDLNGSIDLMLLHQPGPSATRAETWRALEEFHAEGKLRLIGVSNFGVKHLEKLSRTARVRPAVNQVELTPWLQRRPLVDFCRSASVALEAYSPLVKGQKMTDATLKRIAARRNATPAQVLIAWGLRHGFILIPKTTRSERMKENFESQFLQLSDEDMAELDNKDQNLVTGWDPSVSDPV